MGLKKVLFRTSFFTSSSDKWAIAASSTPFEESHNLRPNHTTNTCTRHPRPRLAPITIFISYQIPFFSSCPVLSSPREKNEGKKEKTSGKAGRWGGYNLSIRVHIYRIRDVAGPTNSDKFVSRTPTRWFTNRKREIWSELRSRWSDWQQRIDRCDRKEAKLGIIYLDSLSLFCPFFRI